MRRISPPMGRDRITCLPLWREPPDHKAHCWRVPTHCIPWRPATSTPGGSWCSGMVVETVNKTESVPNEQVHIVSFKDIYILALTKAHISSSDKAVCLTDVSTSASALLTWQMDYISKGSEIQYGSHSVTPGIEFLYNMFTSYIYNYIKFIHIYFTIAWKKLFF